jgi:hypothetical protein
LILPSCSASAHLVAYASPHGYGHAAIIRAVVAAMIAADPTLRVTAISQAPTHFFTEWISSPQLSLIQRQCAADFGMKMASSVDVLTADSLAAYRQAHCRWRGQVAEEKAFLSALQPDIVLTCASYLPLLVAQQLSIAAYMVGPFSWYDILAHYCPQALDDEDVGGPMREAYAAATGVLSCEPAIAPRMAYPGWQSVGPIGLPARSQRAVLRQKLALREGEKVALVSLGGIVEPGLDLSRWPAQEGWRWICAGAGFAGVPGLDALGLSVGQAIASCDAVITKPGYGTYVEAACSGAAILYRERPGWPESAGLAAWAARYVGVAQIDRSCFLDGQLGDALHSVGKVMAKPLQNPTGNRQVASLILQHLGTSAAVL